MNTSRFNNLNKFSNFIQDSFEEYMIKETSFEYLEWINSEFNKYDAITDVYSVYMFNQYINMGVTNFKYKSNYYSITYHIIDDCMEVLDKINFN